MSDGGNVVHIDGAEYLAPDDLLKYRIGQHKAVAMVTMDHNGVFTTWWSSGFSRTEIVFAGRALAKDIEDKHL